MACKIDTEEMVNMDIKVGMDFVLKLREEGERQKLHRDMEKFTATLGDDGKDTPKFKKESLVEMDRIAEEFEITEE